MLSVTNSDPFENKQFKNYLIYKWLTNIGNLKQFNKLKAFLKLHPVWNQLYLECNLIKKKLSKNQKFVKQEHSECA